MKSIKKTGKSWKSAVRGFVTDESGQSTTEYVLMLVIIVAAVKMVGSQLKDGLAGLVNKAMGRAQAEAGSD